MMQSTSTQREVYTGKRDEKGNAIYALRSVRVSVDLDAIGATLASKAMTNKSRQSKYLGGLIIVEVSDN